MDPKPRPVQYFSDAYLARCCELTPTDIVRFLEDFKRLYGLRVCEHGANRLHGASSGQPHGGTT